MKIDNRSEILFLYDVKQANPNGDPMDANKPRMDEATGKALVTDVRLKRTIRDYFIQLGYDGKSLGADKDVFIRDVDNRPVTGLERASAYSNQDDFLNKFIDGRLFGAVSAPGKDSGNDDDTAEDKKAKKVTKGSNPKVFHVTGPVQFGMGKSLHPVKMNFLKGTGAFATKEGADQRTFREEYNISYGLIGFHGVVNENAATFSKATLEDLDLLLQAMWDGTKDLLTRSKKGHMPRLLVHIEYSQKGFFIGDLLERLEIIPDENKKTDELEDIQDFNIATNKLNQVLKLHADKILKVTVRMDDRVKLTEPIFTK